MLITSVWFSNRNQSSAVQPNTTQELADDCLLNPRNYTDNERDVINDAVHAKIERGEKNAAVYHLFSLKLSAVVIGI
jgi:hypothetical protein